MFSDDFELDFAEYLYDDEADADSELQSNQGVTEVDGEVD